MNISIEVSMYPLKADFIPEIDGFLEMLHQTDGLKVQTNTMSTPVFGEADLVFTTIQKAILSVYHSMEQCPFVLKVLNGDVSNKTIKNYS